MFAAPAAMTYDHPCKADLPFRRRNSRETSQSNLASSIQRHPHAHRTSQQEQQTAALIFILVLLAAVCFTAAYHLHTSAHSFLVPRIFDLPVADQSILRAPGGPLLHGEPTGANPASRPSKSPIKYLSYLPHSGFHNQRIALENALTLAALLNRTLLLPPARLGAALGYAPSVRLRDITALEGTKSGLDYCRQIEEVEEVEDMFPGCVGLDRWTNIPWAEIVDLDSIMVKTSVKLLEHWSFAQGNARRDFPDEDSWTLDDASAYDFRFFDTPLVRMDAHELNAVARSKKFANSTVVLISSLSERNESLLQLGTLFGSSRLWLHEPEHILLRRRIREGMVFKNFNLDYVAHDISRKLGGQWLGAHVRLGDGAFADKAEHNARAVFWRLVDATAEGDEMNLKMVEGLIVESRPPTKVKKAKRRHHAQDLSDYPMVVFPHRGSYNVSSLLDRVSCRSQLHADSGLRAFNVPLFVSTDAASPSDHPSLARFLKVFPCTFFLGDFSGTSLTRLDGLVNPYDGLALRPFLEPLLDAMVVARADVFVGTEQSTFSQFVADVLARTLRGEDIVERGSIH